MRKAGAGVGRHFRVRPWVWAAILLPIGLLLLDYYAYPYGMLVTGPRVDRGENGLWLSYHWYFGQESDDDLIRLPNRLQEHGIRYAYFHVRFINRPGRLQYHRLMSARRIIRRMHHEAPGVRAIAWVYVGNARGMGAVDLGRSSVRTAMANEARWLTGECGFDGVQWDYEICGDGDANFVNFLDETRLALAKDKLLCVATPLWLPLPFRRWGWSERYYGQVAVHCDQIAVMGYDSGVFLPRLYVWLMRLQVVHVTRAVAQANPQCRVLIGVPTYKDDSFSHRPRAENLKMALRGVREGLSDPHASPSVFAGVALFADYTTRPEDWSDYHRLWQR